MEENGLLEKKNTENKYFIIFLGTAGPVCTISIWNNKRKLIVENQFGIVEFGANAFISKTRLVVSGRSPECSECLLRFMEQ